MSQCLILTRTEVQSIYNHDEIFIQYSSCAGAWIVGLCFKCPCLFLIVIDNIPLAGGLLVGLAGSHLIGCCVAAGGL